MFIYSCNICIDSYTWVVLCAMHKVHLYAGSGVQPVIRGCAGDAPKCHGGKFIGGAPRRLVYWVTALLACYMLNNEQLCVVGLVISSGQMWCIV